MDRLPSVQGRRSHWLSTPRMVVDSLPWRSDSDGEVVGFLHVEEAVISKPTNWTDRDWDYFQSEIDKKRAHDQRTKMLLNIPIDTRKLCYSFARRALVDHDGYALMTRNQSPDPSDWSPAFQTEVLRVWSYWNAIEEAKRILEAQDDAKEQAR